MFNGFYTFYHLNIKTSPNSCSGFYVTMVRWTSRDQLAVRWVNRAQNLSVLSLCAATTGSCEKVRRTKTAFCSRDKQTMEVLNETFSDPETRDDVRQVAAPPGEFLFVQITAENKILNIKHVPTVIILLLDILNCCSFVLNVCK